MARQGSRPGINPDVESEQAHHDAASVPLPSGSEGNSHSSTKDLGNGGKTDGDGMEKENLVNNTRDCQSCDLSEPAAHANFDERSITFRCGDDDFSLGNEHGLLDSLNMRGSSEFDDGDLDDDDVPEDFEEELGSFISDEEMVEVIERDGATRLERLPDELRRNCADNNEIDVLSAVNESEDLIISDTSSDSSVATDGTSRLNLDAKPFFRKGGGENTGY